MMDRLDCVRLRHDVQRSKAESDGLEDLQSNTGLFVSSRALVSLLAFTFLN